MQYLNVPKTNFVEINKQLAGKPRQTRNQVVKTENRPKLLGKFFKFQFIDRFLIFRPKTLTKLSVSNKEESKEK